MKLGVLIDLKSHFVADLLDDWRSHYATSLFSFRPVELPFSQGRVNGWRLRRSLARFLASNDLCFFEWSGPLLITASREGVSRPMVTRLHSYELFEFAPQVNWRAVDQIILVSQTMQDRFNTLYPEHSGKTSVIYNGVQLDRFRPTHRRFGSNLGMLCDIIPIKRVYEVVLALHVLRRQGYCFRLHLAGAPGKGDLNERYYVSLLSTVEKLGLGEQVVFHGFRKEPEKWLQQIDVFVSNSFWEGHQVALLEAMASGCYCLSHSWDGSEEVLPPDYLYLTESDLVEKLVAYAEMSEAERRRHEQRMRGIAEERFDLRRTTASFRALFDSLVR